MNDVHKAAGGLAKDKLYNWLRLDSTVDLVSELSRCSQTSIEPVMRLKGGRTLQGTYVCKELVYAYAMWISPAFHLKVIRAYDRLATQGVAVFERIRMIKRVQQTCTTSRVVKRFK